MPADAQACTRRRRLHAARVPQYQDEHNLPLEQARARLSKSSHKTCGKRTGTLIKEKTAPWTMAASGECGIEQPRKPHPWEPAACLARASEAPSRYNHRMLGYQARLDDSDTAAAASARDADVYSALVLGHGPARQSTPTPGILLSILHHPDKSPSLIHDSGANAARMGRVRPGMRRYSPGSRDKKKRRCRVLSALYGTWAGRSPRRSGGPFFSFVSTASRPVEVGGATGRYSAGPFNGREATLPTRTRAPAAHPTSAATRTAAACVGFLCGLDWSVTWVSSSHLA